MSRHTVVRGGVRLVYQRRGVGGDRPPLVLVQGLGLPGAMWLGLAGGLVKAGHTVLVPDNRGAGASDCPPPPYTMAMLADDTAAVIDHAGVGPSVVVGISLGGMIAQHLALRRPELVRGLVLAATSCGLPHGRLPDLATILLIIRSFSRDPAVVRRIHRALVHPSSLRRNPQLFAAWNRQLAGNPVHPRGALAQFTAAALHSTGRRLKEITAPVELITGDTDRIIPGENSRVLARLLPNAHLTVVPNSGHGFPLERPEALPRAIQRLLGRLHP